LKDRVKLIKEAVIDGRIVCRPHSFPEGICEDCGQWKKLDLDHRLKRSQGGANDKENIDWVCRKCHNRRDNLGDPMNKKELKNGKKQDWQKPHPCKHCKQITGLLVCNYCRKISV
jgi:5-methylcytosine-specific restriction endonuclease McrA